ncbi:polyprenyl synthetase family protein [soil metagenome]
MAESTRLVDLVQTRIDAFMTERDEQIRSITPDLDHFVGFSRDFLTGGKRFRALFCYWGWQAVQSLGDELDPLPRHSTDDELASVVLAATALEVFHAAALVHDDIMDNSDTRRGAASAHKRFESVHADGEWTGDSAAFGTSAALLLGDLLLGWSDELLDDGLELLTDRRAARAARVAFNEMRTEVTLGQYLDILEESSWLRRDEEELLQRAHRVIVYKSAKYSVEAPLAIGGALGGATAEQSAALRAFGLPLGIAYQLRDDLLGVFGDPAVTGKPSGDDLREGKRTILIALARPALPGSVRNLLDELLGDPDLDQQQIELLQRAIIDSGAVDKVERVISRNVAKAIEAITDAPLSTAARTQLVQLAHTVSRRDA